MPDLRSDLIDLIQQLKGALITLSAEIERDYKEEYKQYHGKPKQIKRRAQRNASRRKMIKKKKVKKGDNKDVHHKDHNPANQTDDNLSVTTKEYNRSRN